MGRVVVELREATAGTCGAKAGTLGRLLRAGFRVPDGFVLPFGSGAVSAAELAPWLARLGDPPVAVRSSAAAEDGATASAAGQHDSFLGVCGAEAVASAVRACRASLTSPRALAYRRAAGLPADPAMAVLVQRHVDAEVAGVLFTGERARVEASWGLGESVVHGRVTPDSWTVGPDGIESRAVGDKRVRVDRGGSRPVPAADRDRPCLGDAEVLRVVTAGAGVAALLGMPVDVEWAVADGEIWVLQARPITAPLPTRSAPAPAASRADEGEPADDASVEAGGGAGARQAARVLTGVPGSAGTATGPARIVTGPAGFGRVAAGDVLVCRTTDPAWTPLFAIAAAVVTEVGGVLSHAAIVARERRIPAVLGVTGATTALSDGEPVTVDGDAGAIRPATGL